MVAARVLLAAFIPPHDFYDDYYVNHGDMVLSFFIRPAKHRPRIQLLLG